MLATLLAVTFFATIALVVLFAPGRAGGRPAQPKAHDLVAIPVRHAVPRHYYRSHSAAYWAWRYRRRTRELQAVKAVLHRRWQPTVTYALRLAAAVTGVPYTELAAVAWCESRHSPWATNGQYRGVFQWGPMFERSPIGRAGFSVWDPIANSLAAALTVSREGWRQWECTP